MFWSIEYEYPYEERLRDEFAKAVLVAFVNRNGIDMLNYRKNNLFGTCYQMAEEMMKARQERIKNEQPTNTSSSVQ